MIEMSMIFAATLAVAGIVIGGLALIVLGSLPRRKSPHDSVALLQGHEQGKWPEGAGQQDEMRAA
jgi:hypothetical protein